MLSNKQKDELHAKIAETIEDFHAKYTDCTTSDVVGIMEMVKYEMSRHAYDRHMEEIREQTPNK